MNTLWIILGMAGITFLIRYGLPAFAGKITLPSRLESALQYVPTAVLTAILLPGILIPDGQKIQLDFQNPYLVGGVVAFIIGLLKQNLLFTILAGMGAFFGWQFMSHLG